MPRVIPQFEMFTVATIDTGESNDFGDVMVIEIQKHQSPDEQFLSYWHAQQLFVTDDRVFRGGMLMFRNEAEAIEAGLDWEGAMWRRISGAAS